MQYRQIIGHITNVNKQTTRWELFLCTFWLAILYITKQGRMHLSYEKIKNTSFWIKSMRDIQHRSIYLTHLMVIYRFIWVILGFPMTVCTWLYGSSGHRCHSKRGQNGIFQHCDIFFIFWEPINKYLSTIFFFLS